MPADEELEQEKERAGSTGPSPPTSSFPISSPSFWDAAATTIDETRGSVKRPIEDEEEEGEGGKQVVTHHSETGGAEGKNKKKARFASPNPSPDISSSPLREYLKAEGDNDISTIKKDPMNGILAKKARFASPSLSPDISSSPLRELIKAEDDAIQLDKTKQDGNARLSFLPNRLDPALFDASNAYLASAEYAPNKFGDIGDYMRKKEIKVQTQNRDIALSSGNPNLPQIFSGQSFWINGNTTPPMEELRKMILQRGGEVRPKLWNKGYVKYIIAPSLTLRKFDEFKNYKVVKEGWIVESCKQGKMLDWTRWKLQVVGGWEETGRKGLEGFLRGEPSQRPKREIEEVEEEEEEIEEQVESRDVSGTVNGPALGTSSIPIPKSTATPAATRSLIDQAPKDRLPSGPNPTPAPAATRSLINQSPKIPISPNHQKAISPTRETVPPKVQKPEGAWENYYTKDSNEHAAEALKNSDWRVRNTAERGNEGGFIDGYYQNSRLHHLSTWKAELKVLVATAQQQSEVNSLSAPSQIERYSLSTAQLPKSALPTTTGAGDKVIFHVDFDCFFVSCGLATRPHLRGKPSVVCHSQTGKNASTSEIASASYEARNKGVKNGMSLGRARQLVGDSLQTIPYEFDTYKKFSLSFYTVLMGYADELQAVSVDEALIDVTTAVRAKEMAPEEHAELDPDENNSTKAPLPRDAALELAEMIRNDVRKLTDCEVSIGISHNVLLAKLATRAAKPAGAYHLTASLAPQFLADLDVKDLPSIGYSTANKIEEKFGTTKCGPLLEFGKSALQKTLGPKTGEMVFGYLRGVDDRKLEPHKERKSISAEMNYGIRFRNQEQAEICIRDLSAEVAKRLRQVNAKGRLLTLKLMSRHPDAPIEPPKFLGHGWCETFNKSISIANKGGSATDDPAILGVESVKLLRAMKLDPVELRGVGIQITKLDGEKVAEREVGQGMLSFGKGKKRAREDGEAEIPKSEPVPVRAQDESDPPRQDAHSRSRSRSMERSEEPVTQDVASKPEARITRSRTVTRSPEVVLNAAAGPSRLMPSASSDGIDPDFLAALPDDLKREVKRDHALSKARSRAGSEQVTGPKSMHDQSTEKERASTISPAKHRGMHAAAHITKQLRPKVKTQLKASAIAELPLYGAWNKAKASDDVVDLSADAEDASEKIGNYFVKDLKELGIDPAFLRDLPEDMQREVVDQELAQRNKRSLLHRPADTSRVRQRDKERGRTSASPSRSSRAGSAPVVPKIVGPTIVRPAKPKLFNASTLSEVTDIVTKWIDSRKGSGPASKDANKVQAYFVKCMKPEYGFGGMEMAVEVLRFMRVAIDERWEEEGCEDDLVGSEWWSTWRGFRDTVDQLCRDKFGAGLRL